MEPHHKVRIADEAVTAAVGLSKRYIPARQLPDKAVSLLDTAAARVAISQATKPGALADVEAALLSAEREKAALSADSDLGIETAQRAEELAEQITTLTGRRDTLEADWTAEREIVDTSIEAFDLSPLQHQRLDQLSGGERQRAFIAAVLAQSTDYVLLDEPLNNLDLQQADRTTRQIRRLADDFDKTVVVVLHDVNIAAHHAERLVALRSGRVVLD